MSQDRLKSLIDFAKEVTHLKTKPTATVDSHRIFAIYEHQLSGLPGIDLNLEGEEGDTEVWMTVKRLHQSNPPVPQDKTLHPWINVPNPPYKIEKPRLVESVDASNLPHLSGLEAGQVIALDDYERAEQVKSAFAAYIDNAWAPWAEREQLQRATINLYSKLFTLKQQLDGGILESQIELVWGVGLGIWRLDGVTVIYPLITKLVELSLNPETAALEVRPRELDPQIELDWYASVNNPGIVNLEKLSKEFFGSCSNTFSPYDPGTFRPLLKTASSILDGNGIYWPDKSAPEDRTPPEPDTWLKVTDTWVLFARPRTNNVVIQDLNKLREAVEETNTFPPAVNALVSDPDTNNETIELPQFRGVSICSSGSEDQTVGSKDLFFPKPFNEEQVRIVQLLEVSDGVVVQGPPGTGKTHTIANVICHYLATGRRVLVTSMKDPALAVLREQLPDEIKPLAISLLTSEREGMKQFEHAIQTIAATVQRFDKSAKSREIVDLEETINSLHARIAHLDRRIEDWAKHSLSKICLDGEEIEPQDAAKELVASDGAYSIIPDQITTDEDHSTPLTQEEFISLREARQVLGADIAYLNVSLPLPPEFPDSSSLLQTHQDLGTSERLKREVECGTVPMLANSRQETLTAAHKLLGDVQELRQSRKEIEDSGRSWPNEIKKLLRGNSSTELFSILDNLGREIDDAVIARKSFIHRPVAVPEGIDSDRELLTAIENLANGRKPFGIVGVIGKTKQKKKLDAITVTASRPGGPEDWRHVLAYLQIQSRFRQLDIRWKTLAQELPFEVQNGTKTENCVATAAADFALFTKLKEIIRTEKMLVHGAMSIFPTWLKASQVTENNEMLDELERALKHHLAQHRLANVWVRKEQCQRVLDGKAGTVCDDIRAFLANTLGNPDAANAVMQSRWSELMGELTRLHGLASQFSNVRRYTQAICDGGAPKYAEALRQPYIGAVDTLLPDNWRQLWRLRRLVTHLENTDSQEELKQLSYERGQCTADLAASYNRIIVERTWLKLAENASPSIKSALQAYLTAIQKIGKGTGKRAVRYRRDAQDAVAHANPAVPCWIMPHYRVSESLPPELGCFDLVVIDEASQSDLLALPALLRAEKVLIVGDDKQVSPEGIGFEETRIVSLMERFLGNQVELYRSQMSPERSLYDLCRVVFAKSAVMLKEHFRCVGAIIEYSKREFYNHEIKPLRLPKASERLDPPLIDVLVEDGYRSDTINQPEAHYIINEIKKLTLDPELSTRSIGVVSLLGENQAKYIWNRLAIELDPETIQKHKIACGDARTFQGRESDIMFLSMVSAPNNVGAPLSRDTFAQRFNVAASRAKDRMYLVRSVGIDHLSEADRLRISLISHFSSPFAQNEERVEDLRKLCESPFERELYDELTQRGYRVNPQVKVGHYRIDIVVEGANDTRLAIECDGDKYHGIDKWAADMERQRVLERAGWVFWRCFASVFVRRRKEIIDDLLNTLAGMDILPIGSGGTHSLHTEHRTVTSIVSQEEDEEIGTQDTLDFN